MIHVTCRLTAKNRDQLRNPTLGNRIWATFTFYMLSVPRLDLTIFYVLLVCGLRHFSRINRQDDRSVAQVVADVVLRNDNTHFLTEMDVGPFFFTQPDPTHQLLIQPNPTHGWTQPMSISASSHLARVITLSFSDRVVN